MEVFTILIQQSPTRPYIATVKELPLLGRLEASESGALVTRFQREICFLFKDRPDIKAVIQVQYE